MRDRQLHGDVQVDEVAVQDGPDTGLHGDERLQLVQVHGRAVLVRGAGVHVEVTHAHLSGVARVVLVEVDPEVALTSDVSATSVMLVVLAHAASELYLTILTVMS